MQADIFMPGDPIGCLMWLVNSDCQSLQDNFDLGMLGDMDALQLKDRGFCGGFDDEELDNDNEFEGDGFGRDDDFWGWHGW
ncbi:hypothetical protein FRC12_008793 [Ceratobasidium sp. 428]|nr:hypothetical protein FRC12_008793 [Ceratobasidium sp. 428]